MAGTDGSGHDLTLVSTDSSNNAIFGMTTFAGTGGATIIRGTDNGSGGVTLTATSSGPSTRSVVFSTTALTVPVTIYLSAGNVVNYQHAVTLLTARNSTNTLDLNVLDWGVVANDTLRIGVGGKIQLANALTGFYGATPVAKPTVSGLVVHAADQQMPELMRNHVGRVRHEFVATIDQDQPRVSEPLVSCSRPQIGVDVNVHVAPVGLVLRRRQGAR
jgi:hypothetical protein